MRLIKRSPVFLLLLVGALVVPWGVGLAEEAAPQDDEELLDNPGFEGDYVAHDDAGDVKVAPDWEPWWIEGTDEDQEEGYGRSPSYYWASEGTDPGGTHGGDLSQFWKHAWGTGAGGVYQTVTVPADSKLRLSVWARSYTCHAETIEDDCVEDDAAWMGLQIGIDPEGGTDFYADSVVFTPGVASTENEWEELTLDVDAPGSTQVTVFFMYHPDFPRTENKSWWDDASLTRIGEAEASSDDDSGGDSGGSAQVFAAFVTPQPPQADCSIVHTVAAEENLSSIAVAYYNQGYTDITVPKIKELNNLSSDIIYVGQKLTIIPPGEATDCASAAAPAATEEAAAEEEGTTEEEVTPEVTPEVTEVAETTTGQVCMSLFDDANGNTLRDPEELLLSGGTLSLSGSAGVIENYTTDGLTEPHCFSALTPGEYVASAMSPAGYEMTTVSSWSIQVDAGANLDLTFGAFGTGEVPAEEGAEDGGGEEDGGGFFSNIGRVLIGLSGLLVLAVAGGLGAYFLVFRRT